MRTPLLASACLVCASLGAFADIERTVEKSFEVKEGQRFKLETFNGSIEVKTSSEAMVKINLQQKFSADSDEEADRILSKISLTFESDSEGVTAVAKQPDKGLRNLFKGWSEPLRLRWTVTVPRNFNVDVDTAGGSITVGDLKGRVRADTSGGSIDLGNIDGEVNADTSGGSIKVKSTTGDTRLDTSGGSIHSGGSKAPLVADTSGGSIVIKHAEHTVKADTSGGSIEVGFDGALKGSSSLDTSGGSITVNVDGNAAFDLKADTSAGSVHCELPILVQGEIKKDHLAGKVNGGGPLLRLDTSAGGIRIRKN